MRLVGGGAEEGCGEGACECGGQENRRLLSDEDAGPQIKEVYTPSSGNAWEC